MTRLTIELEGAVYLAEYDEQDKLIERSEMDSELILRLIQRAIEESLTVMMTEYEKEEQKEEQETTQSSGQEHDLVYKTGSDD